MFRTQFLSKNRTGTGITYQVLLELCIFHLCQKKIPFTEGILGNSVLVLVLSQLRLFGQSEIQLYVLVAKQEISDISVSGSLRYWICNSATKVFGFVLLKFSWWVHKNFCTRQSMPESKARNLARNWTYTSLFFIKRNCSSVIMLLFALCLLFNQLFPKSELCSGVKPLITNN